MRKTLTVVRMKMLALALFGFCLPAFAFDQVSLFAVGHQDDWQLFMSPTVRSAYAGGEKIVFVYGTAGDGGLGDGGGGHPVPYYVARESGAIRATRFIADIGQDPDTVQEATVTVNGHALHQVTYKNTVSYFLRLPDGNGDASGFAGTGFQVLQHLREGSLPKITAVDGSTTYLSWADFVATIKAILNTERVGTKRAWVNIAETNAQTNPGDHSDHLTVSHAVQEATVGDTCTGHGFFVEYHSSEMPMNLAPADYQLQAAAFGITISGITDQTHGAGTWEPGHLSWLGRSYLHSVEPAAPCER